MRMRQYTHLFMPALALSGVALVAGGCEREIGHTEKTEIKDDGTVKTEEKTVTEGPGNKTTVTETETVDRPGEPD
jgi:hypothetical protein